MRALVFGGANLRFIHTEIVRDFVPYGVVHHLAEMRGVAREALMRTLEDGDAVGHGEGLEDTASGERAAFIQPQQSVARADMAARQLLGRWLGLDQHGDVGHTRAELGGNAGISRLHELIEFFRSHPSCYSTFHVPYPHDGPPAGRAGGELFGAHDQGESPVVAHSRRVVIAIDGPAGAGKSTIARRLAARLGFTYIDSGAMYRAVALWAVRQNASTTDMHRMEQLALAAGIDLEADGRVLLNGEDVTTAIRSAEIGRQASVVAAIPGVRRALVEKQRALGERTSVVMEGRDIGTVVFPHADVKVFLDADADERINRRLRDFEGQAQAPPAETIAAQIRERDQRDRTRAEAPLAQAPDAVYIDSTRLSPDELEEEILKLVRARVTNGKDFS